MTRTSHVTVYLYANLIPTTKDAQDPTPNLRCISCGKLLGRTNGRILTITNARTQLEEIPPNVPAFQIKCGNCNKLMNVLWQSL